MPLLGTKLHVLNTIWRKKKCQSTENDVPIEKPPYIVHETQEICISEEELKRKNLVYASSVWTCRVTGKQNLTYKEASRSELSAHRTLREHFPKFFEKSVLEHVHLSTQPLECLVHTCSTFLQEQFHISEPVKLKVDSVSNNPIHGVISGIDKSPSTVDDDVSAGNISNSSPNNSDKENTIAKKNSPIKKKYAYTVKVLSEVPIVVHDVPASSIDRVKRIPSKEHIRMFIRSHAMRYGPNFSGPWIVDTDLLRRYKLPSNNPGCVVDRVKLKQMSVALETEYHHRITRKNTDGSDEQPGSSQLAPIFKRNKRFSVLLEENKELNEDELPLTTFKTSSTADAGGGASKKKMKQATLHFGPPSTSKPSGSSGTPSSLNRKVVNNSSNVLPRVAQHLVKMYTENRENPLIGSQINCCAKLLSESDLVKLPDELRAKVSVRREAIQYKKKIMNMTPIQRKAFLLEQRKKVQAERVNANRLVDDYNLIHSGTPLPSATLIDLPSNLEEPLFGRILGLLEFFHCFQNLLMETGDGMDSTTDGRSHDTLPFLPTYSISPLDSIVQNTSSDDDDRLNTDDEEEEIALIESTAPLPNASVKAMRRLGMRQLSKAVGFTPLSADAYRFLARPLCVILRFILRDEDLNRNRELGIKLTKIPVTPYTAPELFRLVLLADVQKQLKTKEVQNLLIEALKQNFSETNEETFKQEFSQVQSELVTLINQLSTSDLHELCPEGRLYVLETAVERIFDLDLIDDHIRACHRRVSDAYNKKMKFLRDRNLRKKEKKETSTPQTKDTDVTNEDQKSTEPVSVTDQNGLPHSASDSDLASVVKRRRLLAAQAAADREQREILERERRAIQAQENAEERLFNAVNRAYDMHHTESRYAQRCQPLGFDRYYRRYWYFHCAPDRLFVEANWGNSELTCSGASIKPESPHVSPVINDIPSATSNSEELETAVPKATHFWDASSYPPSCRPWSRWYCYDQPDQLDQLNDALFVRGIRESRLKRQLLANGLLDALKLRWKKSVDKSQTGKETLELSHNVSSEAATDDASKTRSNLQNGHASPCCRPTAESALAGALLKNILDTEVRLRSGGLGGVPDFTKWQERLADVHSSFGLSFEGSPDLKVDHRRRKDISSFDPDRKGLMCALVQMAEHIMPRFLNVPDFCAKENGLKKEAVESVKGDTEEQSQSDNSSSNEDEKSDDASDSSSIVSATERLKDPESHELRVQTWLSSWRTEVQRAPTLARLNLLHACLDACICWEKSVEDARCRICRHKSDDNNLLLCDGCNLAFHLYCLRPPLRRVPAGDWFCVSCRPASRDQERRLRQAKLARSERRRRRQSDASSDEDDAESICPRSKQSGPKHDTTCLVCTSTGSDMVYCSNCPNIFHLQCHTPAMRHAPRGDNWLCAVCRQSGRKPNSGRQTKENRRSLYQRICRTNTSNDNEFSDQDSSSYYNSRRSNRSSYTKSKLNTPMTVTSACSPSDFADESDEEGTPIVSRRMLRTRRSVPDSLSSLDARFGRSAKRRRKNSSSEDSNSHDDDDENKLQTSNRKSNSSLSSRAICTKIFDAICRQKQSWPFQEAVDADDVPDYYDIITDPVDLSKIREWLNNGRYDHDCLQSGVGQFVRDLGSMFYNAELYNAADSDVWQAGVKLEQFVKNQFNHFKIGVTYSRPALGSL